MRAAEDLSLLPLPRLLRLQGAVKRYAWGGDAFIPELVGLARGQGPVAEYWLGAHEHAPAEVELRGGTQPLADAVAGDPAAWLGPGGAGGFPFLMKVLDVARPLSIQVHPDRAQARAGFDREEALGIPHDAPHRSFPDPLAKPELAVALEPFWLLFGLADDGLVAERLARYPSLAELLDQHRNGGVRTAFEAALHADRATLERWLLPVLTLAREMTQGDPVEPAYWLHHWVGDAHPGERVDRGALGFLLMNILELEPGEAIFQGPGVPHAYLSGRLIELMTCSDNVLRCGLTPKHVDPDAVLEHVDFDARQPTLVAPRERSAPGHHEYRCPVPDFHLARFELEPGQRGQVRARGPAVAFALAGRGVLTCDGERLTVKRGQAALARGDARFSVLAESELDLFVATPGRG